MTIPYRVASIKERAFAVALGSCGSIIGEMPRLAGWDLQRDAYGACFFWPGRHDGAWFGDVD